MRRTFVLILFMLYFAHVYCQSFGNNALRRANMDSRVILVAVMSDAESPFKDALIDSLRSYYEPGYQVKKIVLKKIGKINREDYRLLIVMDKLKANLLFNGKTKKLQKTTDINHVIYFMTTGDPKWKWRTVNNHHIASASEKPRLKAVWKELRSKADNLLQ